MPLKSRKRYQKVKEKVERKNISEMNMLVKHIWEIYKRYWNPWLECNRRKLSVSDEFRESIYKYFPNDPNPVMSLIYNRLWKDSWFISIYRFSRRDVNSWCVMSYNLWWNNYYYMVLWDANINYSEAKVIYWYPVAINNLFVKWDFEKIQESIDLFCETIKNKV